MIKLIHGDCIEAMSGLPNNCTELCITDLPYNVINRPSNGLRKLDKMKADILTFSLADALNEATRICSGSFYFFCGTEQVSSIREILAKQMTTRLCIWQKSNPSPMNGQHLWLSGIECIIYGKKRGATFNEYCKNPVFKYPSGRNTYHPTQKPIKLLEELIMASTNEGDCVLDFTMGSGSVGVACKNLNRKFIGIEKDDKYFEIANQRIFGARKSN